MIRTVWLTAACLVVLGAMAAGKVANTKVANTPAAQTTDEKPLDEATVGVDFTREPMIKADRLEVTYVRQEAPSQSLLQPIDPIIREAPRTNSPAETNFISRHWHDPNATSAAKNKRTARKGKSAADSRDSQAADRSRPSEHTKRCDRSAKLSGFLRSLNLAPACDS